MLTVKKQEQKKSFFHLNVDLKQVKLIIAKFIKFIFSFSMETLIITDTYATCFQLFP